MAPDCEAVPVVATAAKMVGVQELPEVKRSSPAGHECKKQNPANRLGTPAVEADKVSVDR
jgi:hypothetical protein